MRQLAERGKRWWAPAAAVCLWVGLAFGLQAVTTRVVDWYYMTDELLYERLAVSIARTGSPLPALHGRVVGVFAQLYPLLIAPAYRRGFVPTDLHDAHAINAWVMSSAAIPAFLLARRVTGTAWISLAVALLTVTVPWIVYASFLLTEVAAYPAFLWAMLALHATTSRPSHRNDALTLLAVVVAVLARTQFVSLLLVVPVVLLVHDRRAAVARHRLLAWTFAALAALVVALIATGHIASTLGVYGETVHGSLVPTGIGRALLDHVAVLALGLAVLPFIVGAAWLLASLARPRGDSEVQAFASVALVSTLVVVVEGALFDVRYGGAVVRDRYLFYAGPLVLIAFFCALRDLRGLRRSLVAPAVVVIAGFAILPVPDYGRLDVGSPVAVVLSYLLRSLHSVDGTRIFLAVAAALVVLFYYEGTVLLRRSHLAGVLVALTLVALPGEMTYAFLQLLRHNGTAGRPVTVQQGGVFDWIDRTVGTRASVTMVPYPYSLIDSGAAVAYWWDVEFWNESVVRDAHQQGEFEVTPSTFPKDELHFNDRTGRANESLTRYVVEDATESRFRVSGRGLQISRDTLLIDTERPWRTDWLSFGLYDDGWTKPGQASRIRVFAFPHQKGAVMRYLTVAVQAPFAPAMVRREPFELVSNADHWKGLANGVDAVQHQVAVCVPASGFSDVRVDTYGRTYDAYSNGLLRPAGVLVTEIALADEVGSACTPGN
jgi:hypothetical protein